MLPHGSQTVFWPTPDEGTDLGLGTCSSGWRGHGRAGEGWISSSPASWPSHLCKHRSSAKGLPLSTCLYSTYCQRNNWNKSKWEQKWQKSLIQITATGRETIFQERSQVIHAIWARCQGEKNGKRQMTQCCRVGWVLPSVFVFEIFLGDWLVFNADNRILFQSLLF